MSLNHEKVKAASGSKEKLLLHACCAPCMTHPVQVLAEVYDVTLFFYNPNIQPESEYVHRQEEIENLCRRWNFPVITDSYDLNAWQKAVQDHEADPEGGERCEICYRFRLEKTAQIAREQGFSVITTTLSISPHKNADVINAIGEEIASQYGVQFYHANFKKKDGFKKASALSEQEGLYRQNYCGCLYSRRS